MDGLEAIEINFSVCKNIIDFRIDAGTYTKEYVHTDKVLKELKSTTIEDKMVSIQNFGAYSLCNYITFTEQGIPFLMTQNVRHNFIDWSNMRYIDDQSHLMLYKSHCKRNQVLVTMAGEYLGRAAVYDKDSVCSSNQAIAKITLKKGISPYCVATFLNSKYGQNQINRFKTITGQPNINMTLIKSLLIPEFSNDLSQVIEKTVIKANESFMESRQIYEEAERLLIEELRFDNYSEPNEVYSTKSFSESFGMSGRLDAEYYQKRYDDLFAMLEGFNHRKLRQLVSITKSIEPGSEAYIEDGIPFVRVSDISKYGVVEPKITIPDNIVPNIEKLYPKKDTILLSKDGSIGIAYKVQEDARFVTSSALLHLSIMTDEVLPDYLALVLNSKVVQMQAERDAGGSIIQHWKPSEIDEIVIPIIDIDKQRNLSRMIQKSFDLQKESEELLARAIQIMETAIEYGESEALK